jgi:hypothetical protein
VAKKQGGIHPPLLITKGELLMENKMKSMNRQVFIIVKWSFNTYKGSIPSWAKPKLGATHPIHFSAHWVDYEKLFDDWSMPIDHQIFQQINNHSNRLLENYDHSICEFKVIASDYHAEIVPDEVKKNPRKEFFNFMEKLENDTSFLGMIWDKSKKPVKNFENYKERLVAFRREA